MRGVPRIRPVGQAPGLSRGHPWPPRELLAQLPDPEVPHGTGHSDPARCWGAPACAHFSFCETSRIVRRRAWRWGAAMGSWTLNSQPQWRAGREGLGGATLVPTGCTGGLAVPVPTRPISAGPSMTPSSCLFLGPREGQWPSGPPPPSHVYSTDPRFVLCFMGVWRCLQGTWCFGWALSPLYQEELSWQCRVRGEVGRGSGRVISLSISRAQRTPLTGRPPGLHPTWGKGDPAEGQHGMRWWGRGL